MDKYQGGLGFKWGTRPTNIFLANQTLPDLSASEKFLGIRPKLTLSALISFMPEKWVGLNILGKFALIFLALVTGPL